MVLNEADPDAVDDETWDITRVGFHRLGRWAATAAMLLGARLGPARTAGICAVSPALYQSYNRQHVWGAFDSYDDWDAPTPVFGLPALSSISATDRLRQRRPLSHRLTYQFIAQLRTPPAGGFLARRTRRGVSGVSSCPASSPGCDSRRD